MDTFGQMSLSHSKVVQSLHINILQWCSIVAMVAHKAAFDAGEVERLVILVVVILGAEVFIPVAGHILLEESYMAFEEFEAVLSQFIAELATGDDDAPVGVVTHALAEQARLNEQAAREQESQAKSIKDMQQPRDNPNKKSKL